MSAEPVHRAFHSAAVRQELLHAAGVATCVATLRADRIILLNRLSTSVVQDHLGFRVFIEMR